MNRRDDARPTLRCAIYTRKSTEDGLEQEFNSLDAQRDAGEAYIASQKHEGWVCMPDRYDDGGFTGGNMDRPALKRLASRLGDDDAISYLKHLSRSQSSAVAHWLQSLVLDDGYEDTLEAEYADAALNKYWGTFLPHSG